MRGLMIVALCATLTACASVPSWLTLGTAANDMFGCDFSDGKDPTYSKDGFLCVQVTRGEHAAEKGEE